LGRRRHGEYHAIVLQIKGKAHKVSQIVIIVVVVVIIIRFVFLDTALDWRLPILPLDRVQATLLLWGAR
jgi:hypothetical protein